MRRQQATANSRNLRSLALPFLLKNSSIFCGSVQASHSASVIGSSLPQDQVHHPTAPHVLTAVAAVAEDVGVGATRSPQGVSQLRHPPEAPPLVDRLCEF